MSKAILMSIQPYWLEKILNGEKTVEIRKTMPKCNLPVDVYLYCTKGKDLCFDNYYKKFGLDVQYSATINNGKTTNEKYPINGKVAAKFTLKEIDSYDIYFDSNIRGTVSCGNIPISCSAMTWEEYSKIFKEKACMTEEEHDKYFGETFFVAKIWHISDLVIFDKPMELSEFYVWNRELEQRFLKGEKYCCYDGKNEDGEYTTDCNYDSLNNCYRCWNEWSGWCRTLTRPPQSWQYVEVEECQKL